MAFLAEVLSPWRVALLQGGQSPQPWDLIIRRPVSARSSWDRGLLLIRDPVTES